MIIQARVKTGQKKFEVVKKHDGWVIAVKARPEKNLANHEIINELSKEYEKVRIIRGHKTSKKLIELGKGMVSA
ncbi:MAG: DUF167 family protein [Candidatus Aenigmarchaeota archaeon]|nr:DUF167 family protein [Candidatus Aenigmarchaeota archaeon]